MFKKIQFLTAIILFLALTDFATAAPGDLDTTFSNDGIVLTSIGNSTLNIATDIAIQSDGKSVVSINSNEASSDTNLARYNLDGSLDTTFGNNGITSSPFGSEFDIPRAIVLQSDGKILVTGGVGLSPTQFFILRYNTNGTLDTTFDTDGIVRTTISNGGGANTIAVQSDGKIVVGGNTRNNSNEDFFTVVRFNQNGSLDTSFGSSGITLADFGLFDFFEGLVIQPDGKIIGVGTGNASSNNPLLAMIRLNANGSFDTSFDGDGKVSKPLQFIDDHINAVDLQTDGKIVISGQILGSMTIFRYNANGSADTTFGTSGTATFDLGNFSDASDIKVQTDGKIIVGGKIFVDENSFDFALIRLNSEGTLDSGFGNSGRVFTTITVADDEINSIAIQSDGKIIGAGSAGQSNNTQATLVRYLGDETSQNRAKFDFDGDGKTDIGIWRPAPGEWWYLRSSDLGSNAFQFGQGTDTITPADFTGDGKTDIAFFRKSTGDWFVLRSEDNSFYAFPFGTNGDIPIPADFDGDGKDDPAIFRPSSGTWFILNSGGGTTIQQFGANGDVPIVQDYDGDGKADLAIYRPNVSEWYYQRSSDMQVIGFQFGTTGDKAIPADFTGDNKADIAFWRPSTGFWFILRSEDNSFFAFPFGANGDIPVPGDYDGDGKADAAVFRPTNNTWYLQRSTAGSAAVQFGITNDIPIPSAYIP